MPFTALRMYYLTVQLFATSLHGMPLEQSVGTRIAVRIPQPMYESRLRFDEHLDDPANESANLIACLKEAITMMDSLREDGWNAEARCAQEDGAAYGLAEDPLFARWRIARYANPAESTRSIVEREFALGSRTLEKGGSR